MDVASLARNQAVNRVLIGTGLTILPRVFGRVWAGSEADDDRAQVLSRALGARDLTLGAAALLALRDGDPEWVRRMFAAQAFADAVDLAALAGAGSRLPLGVRVLGMTMAAGSAAVALAYAAQLSGADAL
jgi:hypothetical protein